jgi:hypothetical protein
MLIKNTPNTNYCSAFGEYDVVNKTLNLDDFTISWPAGMVYIHPLILMIRWNFTN